MPVGTNFLEILRITKLGTIRQVATGLMLYEAAQGPTDARPRHPQKSGIGILSMSCELWAGESVAHEMPRRKRVMQTKR